MTTANNTYIFSEGLHGTSLMDNKSLLKLAQSAYNSLSQTNKWTGSNSPGKSAFIATESFEEQCFNCDQKGHRADACPKPKNDKVVKINRSNYFEMKKSRDKSSNEARGGPGRGKCRGRCRGSGKGRDENMGKYTPPT